jgi:hypothetical protein
MSISKISLQDDEYYWLNAPAISPDRPLMIGQYSYNPYSGGRYRWFIGGQMYTVGVGVDVIKRIPKPRINKE